MLDPKLDPTLSSTWRTWHTQASEAELRDQLDAIGMPLVDQGNHAALGPVLAAAQGLTAKLPLFGALHSYLKACWHELQDEYDQGLRLCEQALQTPALSDAMQARLLREQGLLFELQGRFDRALDTHRRAYDAAVKLGDIEGRGKAIRNQGIVFHRLGDYAQALTCYQQELALAQDIADPERQREVRGEVFNQLGYVFKDLGNWDESRAAYTRSMEIWLETGDVYRQGQVFNNLGELDQLMGRFEDAERCFQRALDIMQMPEIDSQREAFDVRMNLGFLHYVQGHLDDAQHHYEQAHVMAGSLNLPVLSSQVMCRLGEIEQRRGNHAQAYTCYVEAIRSAEAARTMVRDQEVKIGVLGIRQHIYQAMVLLCMETGRVDEAFQYAESARSRAFLDMLRDADLVDASSTGVSLASQFNRSAVQAHLPEWSALVVFFGTGAAGPSAAMIQHLPPDMAWLREYLAPPDRLLAFVLTTTDIEVVSIPIAQDEIERNFFDVRNGRLAGVQPIVGQPLPNTRPWQVLDEQVFKKIRERLPRCKHVFLVPHGVLHYLPLHALNPAGLLPGVSTVTCSYAPSASVLAHLLAKDAPSSDAERPLTCLAVGVDGLGLSQSVVEAEYVASLLCGQSLVGAQATPEAVLSKASGCDVIHFACHGHFNHTNPMDSSLELYEGTHLTARQILREARLSARLITLSACDTGLNRLTYGDELLGLTRAFLGAGAEAVLVSLWQVHETPTRLFMKAFYSKWQQGGSKAEALREAQAYVRELSFDDIEKDLRDAGVDPASAHRQTLLFQQMARSVSRPFDHPYYWASFLLVGNPG